MRIDKDALQFIAVVQEMKRRRIFVSLVMTTAETQISWWDSGAHTVRTGDIYSARHHLNLLDENDTQEMAFVGRRLGVAFR